jgi:hypothetical protein
MRSFPRSQPTAVETEFGFAAAAILAKYPAADFPSPKHALAQLAGDVEYVCEANRVASLIERTRTPVFLYSFEDEVDPVVVDATGPGSRGRETPTPTTRASFTGRRSSIQPEADAGPTST